jgi:Ser/Thr protein kinase RdoA (MazF antagonist)
MALLNHGENATFAVTDSKRRKFVLRIHRTGYHSNDAILQELYWLQHLRELDALSVPRPIAAKTGEWLTTVASPHTGDTRTCVLFEWTKGRFAHHRLCPRHFGALGSYLGKLHFHSGKVPYQHRMYWNSEGLLGRRPTFGSLDRIVGINPADQNAIIEFRKHYLRRLRTYENRCPIRLGLIHADPHFGNVLFDQGHPALIDFDDCGWGFFVYDLAVVLVSADSLRLNHRLNFSRCADKLLDGYAKTAELNQLDLTALDALTAARRLTMLGWLNSRADNPRIRKALPERVTKALDWLRRKN